MAQDIVGGLFGIDPAVLQQQRYEADAGEALSFANLNPQQQGQYAMYRAGQMFGGDVFPRLAGAENPQMRQARQMQQVKQWITSNNIDMSTAEGLSKAAEYARQNNMTEGSLVLGQAAAKMRQEEAQTYATLKKADAEKLSTFGRMLVDAGYTPGTPEFQAAMVKAAQAELTGKAKGDGSTTNVTIDAGSLAKAMGLDVGKQAAGIEGKYSALDSIADAKKMLKSGIYAGAYGPEQMAAAKYTLGAAGSKQRVENTEQFMSHIGNVVIPRLQEFGGNDSVEELKYLQRVMGGEQRLEPKSLERILDSADRKINRGVERIQSQTTAAGKKAPPPLGPGASREAETKPKKVFNPATGRIEVQ